MNNWAEVVRSCWRDPAHERHSARNVAAVMRQVQQWALGEHRGPCTDGTGIDSVAHWGGLREGIGQGTHATVAHGQAGEVLTGAMPDLASTAQLQLADEPMRQCVEAVEKSMRKWSTALSQAESAERRHRSDSSMRPWDGSTATSMPSTEASQLLTPTTVLGRVTPGGVVPEGVPPPSRAGVNTRQWVSHMYITGSSDLGVDPGSFSAHDNGLVYL